MILVEAIVDPDATIVLPPLNPVHAPLAHVRHFLPDPFAPSFDTSGKDQSDTQTGSGRGSGRLRASRKVCLVSEFDSK